MKNKLFIHEHPPGSGKTHSMLETIKRTECRIVYAAPTLKLIYEIERQMDDCFVITSETPPRGQTVSEYLAHNKEEVDSARVILTTHSTLLRYAEYFTARTLIIDELPLEILQFKSIWTSMEDAAMLRLIMSSEAQVKKRLQEHKQGSSELSDDKAEMLEAALSKEFAIKEQQGKEKYGFHYAYYTDPRKFDGFDQIHLMAATVVDTMPFMYFTKMCGFEPGKSCSTEFNVRGNKMENKVTIYPLVTFDNERDYISREVLEEHFDSMVDVVQRLTDNNIITITNKERERALREPLELIPTKAHGLNAYKHKTEAAVIYSANPNPYQIPFMELCSEALGMEKDYLTNAYINQNFLDVVYQAVTRTAIRVPEDNRPCKFFVPDMRVARWLKSRLPNAVINTKHAVRVSMDKGGGQIGNKGNTTKRGCPVTRALVERGAYPKKAARLIERFVKANGFEPNVNEPAHMLRLYKANVVKSLKDFCFDVSKQA